MHKKVLIISDSAAGLFLASLLERDGHHVTLVCTGDNFNPSLHHRNFLIPFYPQNEEITHSLSLLKPLFLQELTLQPIEIPPQSYEDKILKPFVGFGEATNAASKELSFYNSTRQYQLNLNLETETSHLITRFKGKILKYSELKRLDFSGTKVDKLVINGTEELVFDEYIFMNSPNDICPLVPNDVLGIRTKSRIAKTETWSRLTISYTHTEQIYDGNSCIFLTPSNPTEQSSCVGTFMPALQNSDSSQNSIWEAYIANDFGDDAEYVSNTIKNLRKMIRKAFPQIETHSRESLVVAQCAAGNFSWFAENKEVHQIAENFIFSPEISFNGLGMTRSALAATSTYELFLKQISKDHSTRTEPTILSSN
ncbi:MAG: hypothetical protein ABL927_05840 [Bdellovibrionales bacterium]